MTDVTKTGICSICGAAYDRWGNNAEPVNDGRCCDSCNSTKVIPARIARLHNEKLPGEHVQRRGK